MKIQIENYRSIVKTSLKLVENQINYLIGGNESGKTNILNSLRVPDLNHQEDFSVDITDKTLRNNVRVDERIAITVSEGNSVNSFEIDPPNSGNWTHIDSAIKEKYDQKVNEIKEIQNSIKNDIHSSFEFNLIDENVRSLALSSLQNYVNGIFDPEEDFGSLARASLTFNSHKQEINKINKLRREMPVNYPVVRYIEPILNAKKENILKYPYDSLFIEESPLNNICKKFLDEDTKNILMKLQQEFGNQDDRERYRRAVFDELNTRIKNYFNKFKHIRAYPKFLDLESNVFFEVISKDKWMIDNNDENQRSLGYKSFLRILTELLATTKSEERILYIIDEPEQSLHPYLQEELITLIREVIKESPNLTVLFATHSPYMIKVDEEFDIDSTSFVYRGKNGETKVEEARNVKNISPRPSDGSDGSRNQDTYLFKILFDSKAWNKKKREVEPKIEKVEKKLQNNQISTDKYFNKIEKFWDFQSHLTKK